MSRKLIAFLVLCYALAFACAAIMAVRWPTLILLMSFLNEGDTATDLSGVNWRELGLTHGGLYLFASISFYAASAMIATARRSGIAWYIFGCMAGFPIALFVSFEPGWWLDPSAAEGAVAGAGVAAILLGWAIWLLRYRDLPLILTQPVGQPAFSRPKIKKRPKKKVVQTGPVPAAIARQRASFAAHGRKAREKRERALKKINEHRNAN